VEIALAHLGVVVAAEQPELAAEIDVAGQRGADLGVRAEGCDHGLIAGEARERGGEIEEVAGDDEARAGVRLDEGAEIEALRAWGVTDQVQVSEDERSTGARHDTLL